VLTKRSAASGDENEINQTGNKVGCSRGSTQNFAKEIFPDVSYCWVAPLLVLAEDNFSCNLSRFVKLNQIVLFQFQTQKLKDENFVLKKNISSLYLTAREEIKRKDAQIRNLQDKEVRNRKILAKSQQ